MELTTRNPYWLVKYGYMHLSFIAGERQDESCRYRR